jgi:hypothetical protein
MGIKTPDMDLPVNPHAADHATGGSDAITASSIDAAADVHNLIDTTGHPVSGLTTGHVLQATGATTYGFAAAPSHAPAAHNLVDTTGHPVSGLTIDHVLKATGATTYAFGAQPSHAPAVHNLVDTTGHPLSGGVVGKILRVLTSTTYGFDYLYLIAASAGDLIAKLKGASGQTGDLLQFLDSSDNVLNNVDRHGRSPNPRTNVWLSDDFAAGGLAANVYGQLGWTATVAGSGSVAQLTALANHPGIYRLGTGATGSSRAQIYLWNGATTGVLLPADTFDVTYIVRGNNNTNITIRLGLGNDASAAQPNDGIYFEKLNTETDWYGVCRASSSQTRTSSLVNAYSASNWYRLRLRRVDASTIGFSINDGTEQTVTATIPTAALVPYVVIANAATEDKTMDIDYFDMLMRGMSR